MAMKLTPFTARSIEITFNEEVKELEINFGLIQSMSRNIGNLMEYCQHIYGVVSGGVIPDPMKLAEFYSELCRQARFKCDGRTITTELVYTSIINDPKEMSNLSTSCLYAALIICPLPEQEETAKPAPKRKPRAKKA
jgi:hypothetical protein